MGLGTAFVFMKNIYLWFYCLKISDAVFLLLLMTAGFLYLKRRFCKRATWTATIAGLLTAWLMVILWTTLIERSGNSAEQQASVKPFASYLAVLRGGNPEALRSNFMNMVLFYPVGLLIASLLPKRWKKRSKILLVGAVCCTLSVSIELAQYFYHLGLAETDDVIHNTLGAVIGAWACAGPVKWKEKSTTP